MANLTSKDWVRGVRPDGKIYPVDPVIVSGLQVDSVVDNLVTLSWAASTSPDFASYKLYATRVADSSVETLTTTNISETYSASFYDEDYEFVVTELDLDSNESAPQVTPVTAHTDPIGVPGATYFVGPVATGDGDGRSDAHRTTLDNLPPLLAGNTISMADGDYTQALILTGVSGSSTQPITFQPAPGATPTITGTDSANSLAEAITLTNCDWIVLDGVNIDGTRTGDNRHPRWTVTSFGYLDFCTHIEIKNHTYRYCNGYDGFFVANSEKVHVHDCTMEYCGAPNSWDDADPNNPPAGTGGTGIPNGGDLFSFSGRDSQNSKYCTLENATLRYSGHSIYNIEGNWNIFRNVTVYNRWPTAEPPAGWGTVDTSNWIANGGDTDRAYRDGEQYASRGGTMRGGDLNGARSGRNLLENCTFEEIGHAITQAGGTHRIAGSQNIFRFNKFISNDAENGIGVSGTTTNFRRHSMQNEVYNNEINVDGFVAPGSNGLFSLSGTTSPATCAWNRVYNNAISAFKTPFEQDGVPSTPFVLTLRNSSYVWTETSHNDSWTNNTGGSSQGDPNFGAPLPELTDELAENIFAHNTFVNTTDYLQVHWPQVAGNQSLAAAQAAKPANVFGNQGGQFKRADGGMAHAQTTNSGTGTVIELDTVRPFVAPNLYLQMLPGTGDEIVINGQTTRITEINEATKEITVDTAVTWNIDDDVSLEVVTSAGQVATGANRGPYYVSPTGVGSGYFDTDPTTLDQLPILLPGDTVYMAEGSYETAVSASVDSTFSHNGTYGVRPVGLPVKDTNGTQADPIRFVGAGTGAVLKGPDAQNSLEFALYVDNCSWIEFENIHADGSRSSGLNWNPRLRLEKLGVLLDSTNITMNNCTFVRCNATRGFLLMRSDLCHIHDSTFQYCGHPDRFQDADPYSADDYTNGANPDVGDLFTTDETSKYNLIVDCNISYGGHIPVAAHGEYNIFRRITTDNAWPTAEFGTMNITEDHPYHSNYNGSGGGPSRGGASGKEYLNGSPFGNRSGSTRGGSSNGGFSGRNVIEHCTIPNCEQAVDNGEVVRLSGSGTIYRFNKIELSGSTAGVNITSTRNQNPERQSYSCEVYNNEFVDITAYFGFGSHPHTRLEGDNGAPAGAAWNRVYNNAYGSFGTNGAIYRYIASISNPSNAWAYVVNNHPDYGDSAHPAFPSGEELWSHNEFKNNTFVNDDTDLQMEIPGTDGTVSNIQARGQPESKYVSGNVGGVFKSATAGMAHAKTTDSGVNEAIITLDTVRPFVAPNLYLQLASDEGDLIVINGVETRITEIDEASKQITVSPVVTWDSGMNVAIASTVSGTNIATGAPGGAPFDITWDAIPDLEFPQVGPYPYEHPTVLTDYLNDPGGAVSGVTLEDAGGLFSYSGGKITAQSYPGETPDSVFMRASDYVATGQLAPTETVQPSVADTATLVLPGATADWETRILDPGVVWHHNFDSAAEVNAFRWATYRNVGNPSLHGNDPDALANPFSPYCSWQSSGGADGGGYLRILRPAGGNDVTDWIRPFSPLTGASNGRGEDDPGANNTLALQTLIATQGGDETANWGLGAKPGWYGWEGQQNSFFDGTDFYLQIRVRKDSRRMSAGNPQGGKQVWFTSTNNSYTQQEIVNYGGYFAHSGDGTGVPNIHTAYQGVNYSSIQSVSTDPIQQGTGTQLGRENPLVCDPYAANAQGNPTLIDGCWSYSNGWDTMLYHITPGRNGVAETRFEVWAAHPGENSYTKIWDCIYPAGFNQGATQLGVPYRDGWNALMLSAYTNGLDCTEFFEDYDQVIFSKNFIPCPQV